MKQVFLVKITTYGKSNPIFKAFLSLTARNHWFDRLLDAETLFTTVTKDKDGNYERVTVQHNVVTLKTLQSINLDTIED